jgi:hypothetical protein
MTKSINIETNNTSKMVLFATFQEKNRHNYLPLLRLSTYSIPDNFAGVKPVRGTFKEICLIGIDGILHVFILLSSLFIK